jgi:hypothetical protein
MGELYDKEVLADTPLGYWPLDDDVLTALDKSGNARNGTVTGSISLRRKFAQGGYGMQFNGVAGSGIFVPDSNALTPATFSIEAIIDIAAGGGGGTVLRKEVANSSWPEYGFYFSSADGTIRSDFWTANNNSAGTRKELVGPDLRGVGERHVLTTYDGAYLKIFVEGVEVASRTATGAPWNSSARLAIGTSDYVGTASGTVNGKMRSIAFYGAALSTTRIAAHVAALRRKVAGVVDAGDPPAHVVRKLIFVSRSGEVLGESASAAGTGAYALPTTERGAVYGIAFVDYGDAWNPSTAYSLAAKALTRTNNGHWYEVETAGTTGSSEPAWPTSGGTVTDGTVVWRDKGLMERPWAEGPYVAPVA